MEFCENCQRYLIKDATPAGNIVFTCICGYKRDGTPIDSLMFEEYYRANESSSKYDGIIRNAPYDLAANVVEIDCPKCQKKYMNLVRVGTSEITYYTCECGARLTHAEYNSRR